MTTKTNPWNLNGAIKIEFDGTRTDLDRLSLPVLAAGGAVMFGGWSAEYDQTHYSMGIIYPPTTVDGDRACRAAVDSWLALV